MNASASTATAKNELKAQWAAHHDVGANVRSHPRQRRSCPGQQRRHPVSARPIHPAVVPVVDGEAPCRLTMSTTSPASSCAVSEVNGTLTGCHPVGVAAHSRSIAGYLRPRLLHSAWTRRGPRCGAITVHHVRMARNAGPLSKPKEEVE